MDQPQAAKKKILVVDDDPVIRNVAVMALQGFGFEVLSAGDGEEGIKTARAAKPDLMVLDLAMPRMHGYEVCQTIRGDKDLNYLKIIVTSGKNYPVDIKTAKNLGADMYMVKPYTMKDLFAAINGLLGLPGGQTAAEGAKG